MCIACENTTSGCGESIATDDDHMTASMPATVTDSSFAAPAGPEASARTAPAIPSNVRARAGAVRARCGSDDVGTARGTIAVGPAFWQAVIRSVRSPPGIVWLRQRFPGDFCPTENVQRRPRCFHRPCEHVFVGTFVNAQQ